MLQVTKEAVAWGSPFFSSHLRAVCTPLFGLPVFAQVSECMTAVWKSQEKEAFVSVAVTLTLLLSCQGAGAMSFYLLSLFIFFAIGYADYYHLDQKSMTGIVVGVCIALTCILICILILIYRSKARYVFVLKD